MSRVGDDGSRPSDFDVPLILETFLQRIAVLQPRLNAFITVAGDSARAEALRVADRTTSDDLPLAGMVIAVKDNIDVGGMTTTVGSAVYKDRKAANDAVVVRHLRRAGAIIVGKTFLHEFALGQSCASATYGVCRNPWDLDRIPGGSSGGSAVAVAADLCSAALGTDTGGSIRVPASLNGVSGLRPTFGRLSNRGVFPLAPSFDTVGPMARTVSDVATVLAAARGSRSPDDRRERRSQAAGTVRNLRIGIPQDDFFEAIDEEVARSMSAAIDVLQSLGAELSQIDLPGSAKASMSFARLLRAEAALVHKALSAKDLELVDREVAARIAVGREITSAERTHLYEQMLDWQHAVNDVFDAGVDLLMVPATPSVAPKLDELDGTAFGRLGRITQALSFALLPALSIPSEPSPAGLPIGVQLVGRPWSDDLLLDVGEEFQRVTDWHQRRPRIAAVLLAENLA